MDWKMQVSVGDDLPRLLRADPFPRVQGPSLSQPLMRPPLHASLGGQLPRLLAQGI